MQHEITLLDIAEGVPIENAHRLTMVMWDIPNTLNATLIELEKHNVQNATVVIPTNYRIVHKDAI